MKSLSLFAALALSAALGRADVICQWNFNSAVADDNTATGLTTPSFGAGAAGLLGGVTDSFATGASKDTAAVDNSAWALTKFPQVMVSNRTAGVRFTAGTVGFEGISITWAQQNSSTASRYARVQYTTDGTTFQDLPAIAVVKENAWTNMLVNLASVPGVDNNPNFAFQIVTEFESTAAGGLPGYMPTLATSSYLPAGVIKLDMVTISGTAISDGNTPPHVFAQIAGQVLSPNESTGPLAFMVLDAEEPAANLTLRASSSAPSVVPLSNITLGGSGANRTVTVRAGTSPGSSTIAVYVIDSGAKSNSFSFAVTVLPADRPPSISCLAPAYTLVSCDTAPLAFTVEDAETPAANLAVSASAADSTLVPESGFVFGGAGSNRTLVIKPAAGRVGATPVTLLVSDGSNTTQCVFPCVVLPSPKSILYDSFNYADGSLTANSGSLWLHRSGTAQDCLVSAGRLHLSEDRTEDVSVVLHGGPFETGTGTVLYASFKLQVPTMPRALPEYFAHFISGGSLVGRIYIGTTNAVEGCYRLSVANGSEAGISEFPMSMDKNVLYTVVLRYDVDSASSRLWVNPQTEASPSVTAVDSITPVRVSSFGFRQSDGIGTDPQIDEVKIGLTFESVTSMSVAPVLRFSAQGTRLSLSWDDPQFRLQCGANPSGPYTNVPGATNPWQITPPGRSFFRLAK